MLGEGDGGGGDGGDVVPLGDRLGGLLTANNQSLDSHLSHCSHGPPATNWLGRASNIKAELC